MLRNLRFVVVILLFTGVLRIQSGLFGDKKSTSSPVRTDIKGRLLTPAEGCGYSKVAVTRIVGGSPAKNGAWPWMALIAQKKGKEDLFLCGGSLITTKHVLTAAHCLAYTLNFVRLGEYDISTITDGKHKDIDIVHAVKHERYIKNTGVDEIAMIYLKKHVDFNDRISPICLPDTRELLDRSFVGTNPFIAGWGRTSENGTRPNILQQLQVPVLNNTLCKEKYRAIDKLNLDIQFSALALCAGYLEGGKDSCVGDSGGPLMFPVHSSGTFAWYQIGIVAYGIGCARPNVPGMYTNLQQYMDWIDEKLKLKV